MSFLYPHSNWRFFDPAGSGSEDGTFLKPYHGTLAEAVDATPHGGALIVLSGGSFPEMTFGQPLTIRVPQGALVVE